MEEIWKDKNLEMRGGRNLEVEEFGVDLKDTNLTGLQADSLLRRQLSTIMSKTSRRDATFYLYDDRA